MRRGLLLLSIGLVALAVVPAATANKPVRVVTPVQGEMTISDQCAFPVLAHLDGMEINTTFFDKDGNAVKLMGVFPGQTQTFTNVDTDTSITVSGAGLFQERLLRDGSVSFMVTGHGVWFGNPLTDEPGLWYQSGRLQATFDADGNLVSMSAAGTLVNLCDQLAS